MQNLLETNEVASRLAALPNPQKVAMVLRTAFFVTIAARDTYELHTAGVHAPARLRAANELQHKLLGYAACLSRGEKTYPESVLLESVAQLAREAGINFNELANRLISASS